jgi:hypothetical protein
VYTVDRLAGAGRDAVEEEGRQLLALLRPGAADDVVFEVVGTQPVAPTARR